jgi:hypothetical protein
MGVFEDQLVGQLLMQFNSMPLDRFVKVPKATPEKENTKE